MPGTPTEHNSSTDHDNAEGPGGSDIDGVLGGGSQEPESGTLADASAGSPELVPESTDNGNFSEVPNNLAQVGIGGFADNLPDYVTLETRR